MSRLTESYSLHMAAAVRRTLATTPTRDLRALLPGMYRRGGHGWQLLCAELLRRPAQLLLPA